MLWIDYCVINLMVLLLNRRTNVAVADKNCWLCDAQTVDHILEIVAVYTKICPNLTGAVMKLLDGVVCVCV